MTNRDVSLFVFVNMIIIFISFYLIPFVLFEFTYEGFQIIGFSFNPLGIINIIVFIVLHITFLLKSPPRYPWSLYHDPHESDEGAKEKQGL
ncbi:MAG: hypothetical protein P1Q69_12425 [Candidatus Thorarchaeota archaeon]|nr:hypothetical protein [Candidatus Thorarchaeota archaeon]